MSSLNYSQFIWNVADVLRGTYKQHQYGQIILPFTVLARLDAVLEPTKQAVLQATEGYKLDTIPPAMLAARAGHDYSFYNLSQHSLKTVANDPDTLEQNLRSYINQFSENVRDIFEKYKFEDTIADLAAHNLLYQVIQHFSRVNLHPDQVSNEQMGNIFEELIRKFAEASNETAGEHFTPREVIELMVNLLLADDEDLRTDYIARSVYDPTAGTGGMLSVADDKIHQLNPTADVSLLGQELNPESYAICKADMVVKGQDVDNIALGNTLTDPAFENRTFHYGLSNPPFGLDWKGAKSVVEAEHKNQGFAGRFGAGLPRVSDGSLLFLQHLISKLNEPTVASNGVAQEPPAMSRSHLERPLQQDICAYLAAHGWVYSPNSAGYDAQRALYPADVLTWLQTSDPKNYHASPTQTRGRLRCLYLHLTGTSPNSQLPK